MASWNEYKRVHGLDRPAPEVLNPPKKKRPPPPNLYKPIIAIDERSPGIASTASPSRGQSMQAWLSHAFAASFGVNFLWPGSTTRSGHDESVGGRDATNCELAQKARHVRVHGEVCRERH